MNFMPKKSKTISGDSCRGDQVEELYPATAQWVQSYGHIEIGDQDGIGFIVRALDYGGLIFEDDKPRTLAESMTSLEKALNQWFEEEGIEIET